MESQITIDDNGELHSVTLLILPIAYLNTVNILHSNKLEVIYFIRQISPL